MNNFFTFFIFFFSIHLCHGQSLETKIDSIIYPSYSPNEPGISIIVTKDGKPIYKKAFGTSNMELNTPMNIESVFQIGSITKQFTAVSILMLAEKGKLNLNDKIVKYIPDYPISGKNITINHLLNHTSGIKNSTPVSKKGAISKTSMSSVELVDYFKNEPLDFIPGDRFKYSNAGYILLGRIIEVVSGQSYEDFIENNIFNKIEMTSSYYGNRKEIIKNRVSGYHTNQNIYYNADYISLTLPYAAGSILSTVGDLWKWQNALNSNILIKRSSFEKAIRLTVLNSGKKIPYGYGFRITNLEGSPVIAHTGSTKGFTSIALFLPNENAYIVILTNCNCKNISEIAKKIAIQVIDKPISKSVPSLNDSSASKKKSISAPLEVLKQFTGIYSVKANVNIRIGLDESNNLYLVAPGQSKKIELFTEAKDVFYVKISNAKITFNKNEKDEVVSLTLNQSGRQVLAIKK